MSLLKKKYIVKMYMQLRMMVGFIKEVVGFIKELEVCIIFGNKQHHILDMVLSMEILDQLTIKEWYITEMNFNI